MPTGQPVDLAAVKRRLNLDDNVDDLDLQVTVEAVAEFVGGLPIAQHLPVDGQWPKRITLGALLLCVRLDARKNSPDGVAAFNADGPLYVQRNDPDVAMMLQLGQHAKPSVG